jgi:outer membrane protein OmpA-like peptidoglycan-associated protein
MGKAFAFFVLFATVIIHASAQTNPEPYYVIVGGFASRDNAERFTDHLLKQNYPARYALNTSRKLYYVYVRLTPDKQNAKQLAYHLRLETEFKDAWIYTGSLEGNSTVETTMIAQASGTPQKRPHQAPVAEQENTESKPAGVVEPIITGAVVTTPAVTEAVIAPATVVEPPAPAGKRFVFQLTNAVDNTPVSGTVHLLESENADHIDRYDANAQVSIPAPSTGKLIVICNLLGYKLAKRAISYSDPVKSIKGASVGAAQEVIIPIKLVPVATGDYIELERVKFHERSAILTPDSESELQELLSLMNNPRCKIKLYGHTHDNTPGEIITMGASERFFALDPSSNRAIHGSAKDLSRHRAEAVKAYLVSKGISPGRIATKGYGAVLAIYEHANANERIEVQITRN